MVGFQNRRWHPGNYVERGLRRWPRWLPGRSTAAVLAERCGHGEAGRDSWTSDRTAKNVVRAQSSTCRDRRSSGGKGRCVQQRGRLKRSAANSDMPESDESSVWSDRSNRRGTNTIKKKQFVIEMSVT